MMDPVDLGKVKETTRVKEGVTQTIRLFTRTQRQIIMEQVDKRPDTMTIEDVLELYNVSPAVYYTWVRNKKKKDENKIVDDLPNPLKDVQSSTRVFSSESQLRAFYLDNSAELKEFIKRKFQEWMEKDLIAQLATKIDEENIERVAEVGGITIQELKSFLNRENKELTYFAVEAIRRYVESL